MISSAEVITRVAFCTGASPSSSLATMPKAHMSAFVANTSGCLSRACTDSSFHKVAPCGCSWRKYIPFSCCILYSNMQNFKFLLPCSLISLFLSSGILPILYFCSCENAVQIGDPTISSALLPNTMSIALSLFSLMLKSHGFPSSGSQVVRSRAQRPTIFILASR